MPAGGGIHTIKLGLTVDPREAAALDAILARCESMAMEPFVCDPAGNSGGGEEGPAPADDALARYNDNGNGRITCKEARRHGIAPVHRSHPAYQYMRDGEGDGSIVKSYA